MTSPIQLPGLARIAEPGEGIGLDELALATRNHGMPLEALRYDVTPPGLHYVLTHYDIPVDPAHMAAGDRRRGRRGRSRSTLDDLMRRPGGHVARAAGVRRQRAGPARAPPGQPAVAARGRRARAEWTGTPLAPLLEEAGAPEAAVDVVFTGADHGVRARGRAGLRPRPAPGRGAAPGRAAGLGHERRPAPPAARRSAAARRPRLVRHGAGEVADRGSTCSTEPFAGFQNATAYRHQGRRRRGRRAGDPDPSARAARTRPAGRTS